MNLVHAQVVLAPRLIEEAYLYLHTFQIVVHLLAARQPIPLGAGTGRVAGGAPSGSGPADAA